MKKMFILAVTAMMSLAVLAQSEFKMNRSLMLMDNAAKASAVAAETEDLWGYYSGGFDNEISGLGTSNAGTFRVAIFVPGDGALKGAKITAINVPILSANSTSVSVWGGTTVGSKNAFEKSVASVTEGYNKVVLDSEVAIPAEGLYVGYTFKISSTETQADKYPIGCSKNIFHEGGLYLSTSATGAFEDYSSQFGVSILQIFVKGMTLPENSLVINGLYADACAMGGKGTVLVSLGSDSKNEIKNFGYTMNVNGVETTGTCTMETPIPAGLLKSGYASIEFDAPNTIGSFPATIAINTVNGVENEAGNAASEFAFITLTHIVPRVSVIEEYTGTGCGYCPRGWVGMEAVKEKRADNALVIAWHRYNSSDPMYASAYASLPFDGAPQCCVDRKTFPDPYFGEGQEGILNCLDAYNTSTPLVDITAAEAIIDNDLNVTVKSNTEFLTNVNGYTIAFVLTADSLRGTTTAWKQSNYFYSATTASAGVLDDMPELSYFCKGGKYGQSSVLLTFNDVMIASSYVSGKSTVPAFTADQQVAGNTAASEYTLTMPTKATLVNALQYNKIFANVLVIDNNGYIANAKRVPVLTADGTEFRQQYYKVTYKVDGEVYATDSVLSGTALSIANPTKEGYTFSGWSASVMPAHDLEVNGSFTINTYSVTLSTGNGGTAMVSNTKPQYGSSVVLTVTPNEGYQLAKVTVNSKDVTADVVDNTYTIDLIKANVKIAVTFSAVESGIEQIASDTVDRASYDLFGHQVLTPVKGSLYIRKGRKMIIK